jgi:hypothetical protein
VALAPYMIPFYSLILLGMFFAVNLAYPLMAYWKYFLVALGATLSYHAALTFFALKQKQPDLKSGGKFLSGVLIFLGNAIVLVFLLGVLFPKTVSWAMFLRGTKTHTVMICRQLISGSTYLWNQGQSYPHAHPTR